MTTYQKILLCVDFSEDAHQVAMRARDLADRYNAELRLIHVVEHVPVDAASEFMAPPQVEMYDELLASAEQQLHRMAERLGVSRDHCCVATGYTKQEIISHADDVGSDLIVVGSHGRHGLALLLGSTANALLHGAACDVLAVRV
ncbi:MAG: universal stress protein [Aquisalimonadaceae bacterium]